MPRKAAAPEVAAEAAAQDQGSVWAAVFQGVEEARAALGDPAAAAAALALVVPVVEVVAELMPTICGVRPGRVVVAEVRAPALGSVVAAAEAQAPALAGRVVEVVQAAEPGSVGAAEALAARVVEVVQVAGHRGDRRPANG